MNSFVPSLPLSATSLVQRIEQTRKFKSQRRPNMEETSTSPQQITRATVAAPIPTPISPPSQPTLPLQPEPTAPATPAPSTQPAYTPGFVVDVKTPAQFDAIVAQAVSQDALMVTDFMAKWCRKCKYLLPRMRKLAAKFPNVYFCTVDVNAVERLPRQFEIAKMPTFVFLKRGSVVHSFVGGSAPQQVAEQLDTLVDKFAS